MPTLKEIEKCLDENLDELLKLEGAILLRIEVIDRRIAEQNNYKFTEEAELIATRNLIAKLK